MLLFEPESKLVSTWRDSAGNTQKGGLLLLNPKSKVMLSLAKVTSEFRGTKACIKSPIDCNSKGLKRHYLCEFKISSNVSSSR